MLGLMIATLLMPVQAGAFGERENAMRKAPRHDAARQTEEYTDCLVNEQDKRAAIDQLLREFPGDGTTSAAGRAAVSEECVRASMRNYQITVKLSYSYEAIRAALYPALYRRDFGRSGPPAGIAALEPLTLSTEFDRDIATLPADYRPRRALGDCVSREAPQDTHALLTAAPYSKAEDSALSALSLPLAKCLPKGETFRLNRATLRASIGEAMYKLALAARTPKP
ncbi:hypothetical protein [Sphingomonas suaedae]|nr:hypothetical protein [Sphingomonas suaedae]